MHWINGEGGRREDAGREGTTAKHPQDLKYDASQTYGCLRRGYSEIDRILGEAGRWSPVPPSTDLPDDAAVERALLDVLPANRAPANMRKWACAINLLVHRSITAASVKLGVSFCEKAASQAASGRSSDDDESVYLVVSKLRAVGYAVQAKLARTPGGNTKLRVCIPLAISKLTDIILKHYTYAHANPGQRHCVLSTISWAGWGETREATVTAATSLFDLKPLSTRRRHNRDQDGLLALPGPEAGAAPGPPAPAPAAAELDESLESLLEQVLEDAGYGGDLERAMEDDIDGGFLNLILYILSL